jgi:hypothetical protein
MRLSDRSEARYSLDDLDIDPSWVDGVWEAAVFVSGSSEAFQVDAAEVSLSPVTATTADDGLYVGGVGPDGARVVEWDLASLTFIEVDIAVRIGSSSTPLLAVTSLRTAGGVAVAGISTPGAAIAARLDGTARAGWAVEGATDLAVAELAVRGGQIATVGYPGVVVARSDFAGTGVTSVSVRDDFGIADRHPTGITLTDGGLIALPQRGTDPSSSGSDGSAWLIDLSGSAAKTGD